MAKKPKKDADAGDAAEGEGAPQGGSKKKKILIAAAGALALAGAGGGYVVFAGKKQPESEKVAAKKPAAFLDVREMLINLAPEPNQDRAKFIKLRASLEVADPNVVKEIQPLLPRVEDAFQVFVRELRASDLEGSAGVYRLREELLRRVNVAVAPARVDAVLFREVVVQ